MGCWQVSATPAALSKAQLAAHLHVEEMAMASAEEQRENEVESLPKEVGVAMRATYRLLQARHVMWLHFFC